MNRNLKSLALALFILSAFAGATASAASAKPEFHGETEGLLVTGKDTELSKDTFSIPGIGGIICETASFEGTMSGKTSTSLTVTPKYANCHLEKSEVPVPVVTTGCSYLITLTETTPVTGIVHLECKAGVQGIYFEVGKCKVTIDPQTFEKLEFENTGSGMSRDVDVIEHIEGIETTSEGTCEGPVSPVSMTGRTTMTAETPLSHEQMGIWVQ
jgi:hypothetical protein